MQLCHNKQVCYLRNKCIIIHSIMNGHTCETAIVTCSDFRFQEYIDNRIAENFPPGSFDRVAIAGGVFDFEYVLKQIEISKRLHHIKKVVLINHEDCGAYGEAGTPEKHA